jgi:hypothetical protein
MRIRFAAALIVALALLGCDGAPPASFRARGWVYAVNADSCDKSGCGYSITFLDQTDKHPTIIPLAWGVVPPVHKGDHCEIQYGDYSTTFSGRSYFKDFQVTSWMPNQPLPEIAETK